MWSENLRSSIRINRKLLLGSLAAGAIAVALPVGGYVVVHYGGFTLGQQIVVLLLIAIAAALSFGLWTVKASPRYPQTPLEAHQEAIEVEVETEWGKSLEWLRAAVASAEECSESVIKIHRQGITDGQPPEFRQTFQVAMHCKVCDLARAVADLCQRGHAEAAFMIWRSIFEIEVNMAFIAQEGTNDRGERFRDWATAAVLRSQDANNPELAKLKKKYQGWQLDRDIGWTRKNNPMGIPARAKAVGYSDTTVGNEISGLFMYAETNAYVHNDARAIFNDLGRSQPFDKGPSGSGLDMPLCLTARSLSIVTDILICNVDQAKRPEPKAYQSYTYWRHTQVLLEVAMIPQRLLSPYRGFDLSFEMEGNDGRVLTFTPARRESSPDGVEKVAMPRLITAARGIKNGRQKQRNNSDNL
ncbi:MAG: DUF5677 domain-containing protein [Chloroflexi bacterium]|nr:DUF5677 domain-containing protein [Chloroflexota bacterium]